MSLKRWIDRSIRHLALHGRKVSEPAGEVPGYHFKSGLPRKDGFTLIELMVVIAIIGILAAIGSYWLGGHMKKAREITFNYEVQNFVKQMDKTILDTGSANLSVYNAPEDVTVTVISGDVNIPLDKNNPLVFRFTHSKVYYSLEYNYYTRTTTQH